MGIAFYQRSWKYSGKMMDKDFYYPTSLRKLIFQRNKALEPHWSAQLEHIFVVTWIFKIVHLRVKQTIP